MAVKWNKDKKFSPIIILNKLNKIKRVKNGIASFEAFNFSNCRVALQNMLIFPENIEWMRKDEIISKAISKKAAINDLTLENVISEINSLIRKELEIQSKEYLLLTSISLSENFPKRIIIRNGCSIKFLKKYNSKFRNRDDYINKCLLDTGLESNENPHYRKIVISVRTKFYYQASFLALRELDVQRAIWSLICNYKHEIPFGYDWIPINKIRLGRIHTIHNSNGSPVKESLNYEPNYENAKLYSLEKKDYFLKISNWAINKLDNSNYCKGLEESLIRYVRALDEKDQNVSIILLWGAIESLASPDQANYSKVIQRCSFLFEDIDYHVQILEHLRKYRNNSIHAGMKSENVRPLCYQLQFYFKTLVFFHLRHSNFFTSLQEANNFLDLPNNLETLIKRKKYIDKAIKFIS